MSNKSIAEAIRPWMFAFVVCNFNVDVGPEVELVYPPTVQFSTQDFSGICFSSFPERHESEALQDIYFTYTLSNTSLEINLNSPAPPYGSPDLLFGSCVFRQEYDKLSKRSYNQKSLVIISNHEFPAFFMNVLRILASGASIGHIERLEVACNQISQWPAPQIGRQQLPFLGTLLDLDIPPYPSFPLQGLSSSLSAQQSLLPNMSSDEPPEHWHNIMALLPSKSTLYPLYERAILGLPTVILGQSPHHVSALVHLMRDLIRPLPYAGLYRPYLPMQIAPLVGAIDFLDASNPACQTPFILGITNPFLVQRLDQTSSNVLAYKPLVYVLRDIVPKSNSNLAPQKKPRPTSFISSMKSSPKSSSSSIPSSTTAPALPETLYIKPTSFLPSSKPNPPTHVTTQLIRRHFADLTARILAPINRFLLNHSPEKRGGEFPLQIFLHTLDIAATECSVSFLGSTNKSQQRRRNEFYSRLCSGENFRQWLEVCVDGASRHEATGMLGSKGSN